HDNETSSFESESSEENEDATDEETERHQTTIDGLINKLKRVQEKQSMLSRPHRNIGHSLVNKLPAKTVSEVKSFIKSVGKQYGEALVIRKYIRKKKDEQITVQYEKHDFVFLPSHYSNSRLSVFYNLINLNNTINHWTFRRIWKDDNELGKIIIRKLSKDVCDECSLFKCALKERSNVNKDLNEQFITHIQNYRAMREAYENDIQVARRSNQSSLCIFSFDFTRNVELLYDPQQPGRWYYSSLLKVHQFELVDEDIDRHWHTLYTEGKALKGANELPLKGLPEEKQVDLWNNIHPYCPIAFHDKFCLKPDDDIVKRISNLKRTREKEAQQKRK
ncbi:15645_t:CDS:2, partial [Racocetra fulgida]